MKRLATQYLHRQCPTNLASSHQVLFLKGSIIYRQCNRLVCKTCQSNSTEFGTVFSFCPFGKLLFILQDLNANTISSQLLFGSLRVTSSSLLMTCIHVSSCYNYLFIHLTPMVDLKLPRDKSFDSIIFSLITIFNTCQDK